MIVHDDVRRTVEHRTAPGRNAIMHQPLGTGGAGDMQPVLPRPDAQPGFVEVLDRCVANPHAYRGGEVLRAPRRTADHRADGAGRQRQTQQVLEKLAQAVLGQKLRRRQVGHARAQPRPVLHRGRHVGGEGRSRHAAAAGAGAAINPVLGHTQRRGFGQVPQRGLAVSAHRRAVLDHLIGLRHPRQRAARVAGLAARRPRSLFPQAPRPPRRSARPVARRRLAAGRTVQTQPTLKLHHAPSKQSVLLLQQLSAPLQRANQGNKPVNRFRCNRGRHPPLDSHSPVTRLEMNYRPG